MDHHFNERLKKRVGGSLSNLPTLRRVEMLRANAQMLKQQSPWKPQTNDGTLVRKTVGRTR
jgi:hypothetical protein